MTTATHAEVLVVGSANLDFVVRVPYVPAPGETVLGSGVVTFPGGKGANQAVACARAGNAKTRMVVALGDDAHAREIETSLRDASVHADIVRVPHSPTGMAFISLADDAENSIVVAPGANDFLQASHLPSLEGFSHLLLQLETPLATVEACAKAARAAGVQVVLNAAPARALPTSLLQLIDVLIVNEGELVAVTGRPNISIAAAVALIDVPCVIVTLGPQGCLARMHEQLLLQPPYPVDARDTTAAGDTFCGVLTAALCHGAELPTALQRASAAAALACVEIGAQSSIPDHDSVQAFLQAQPPQVHARTARNRLAAYCGLSSDSPLISTVTHS